MQTKPLTNVEHVILHCSKTPPSVDIGVKELDRQHRAKSLFKVGYHFVIRRDGALETGRELDEIGAHAPGHNETSIGVCLVGGVAEDRVTPHDNFTVPQFQALFDLLKFLKRKFPHTRVVGHEAVGGDATCPAFDVQRWLKEYAV